MLSPQDDHATAVVRASPAGARRAGTPGPAEDRARRATTDRFRRTSDRALLGLVAELARADRAS